MRRMTQLSCHTLVGRVVVKRSSDAVCILIYGGVEAIDLATFGVLATTDAFSHPYSPLRYPPRFPYWGRGLGFIGSRSWRRRRAPLLPRPPDQIPHWISEKPPRGGGANPTRPRMGGEGKSEPSLNVSPPNCSLS